MLITLDDLRRFAVAHSLFPPTTLKRALDRLGFVQADPIRAPARAQDLTLRHRVKDYRAGDLERRYAMVDVEEDFFVCRDGGQWLAWKDEPAPASATILSRTEPLLDPSNGKSYVYAVIETNGMQYYVKAVPH